MRPILLALCALAGCADDSVLTDPPTDDTDLADTDTDTEPWSPPEGGRVTVPVGEGVLSARYSPAPSRNAPALILMNRPTDGRADGDFPDDMLDRLSAEGWTWLIFEYRGTRMSTGPEYDLGRIHLRDLESWSTMLADDGYPIQALVDTYGAVSTPFANNAPATDGVPIPCSVTLADAGNPEGLDFIRKTPEGVRRQFQYDPRAVPGEAAQDSREYDPGDWVYQEYKFARYDKSMYWYAPEEAIDDLITFHRETFPRCQ